MKKTAPLSLLFAASIVVPLGLYFWVLSAFAVNAPQLDDYMDTLVVMSAFREAGSWVEKLSLLFAQYHEHRYLTGHALAALFMTFFGALDFRFLMVAGNLALLGFAVLLARQFSIPRSSLLVYPLTALMLFNLQAPGSMFWATAAWAHYGLLFFALASFVALVSPRAGVRYGVTALCATLALFTQANGIVVLLLLFLFAAGDYRFNRASLFSGRFVLFCLCLCLLLLAVYFAGFDSSQRVGETRLGGLQLLGMIAGNLLQVVLGFLLFLGGLFAGVDDTGNSLLIFSSAFTGLLVLAAFGWLCFCYRTQALYPLKLLMLLVFASAVSVACLRVSALGISQALQAHYKIYSGISILFLLFVVLLWSGRLAPNRQWIARVAVLSVAFGIAGFSYVRGLPLVAEKRDLLVNDFNQWLETNRLEQPAVRFYVPKYNRKLHQALSTGVYNPAVLLHPSRQLRDVETEDRCPPGATPGDGLALSWRKGAWGVRLWGDLRFDVDRDDGQQLWLCSPEAAYRLTLSERNRLWLNEGRMGFDVLLPRTLFPQRFRPDDYFLWVDRPLLPAGVGDQ